MFHRNPISCLFILLTSIGILIGCDKSEKSTNGGRYQIKEQDRGKYDAGYASEYSSYAEYDKAITAGFQLAIDDLFSSSRTIRTEAGEKLQIYRMENAKELTFVSRIPDLVRALAAEEESIVFGAAKFLRAMSSRAQERQKVVTEFKLAVNELINVLLDESKTPETRRWTAMAIKNVGRNLGDDAMAEFIPALELTCHDESYDVHDWSLDALAGFRHEAQVALPNIFVELRKKGRRGMNAAEAIQFIGSNPEDCVAELIGGLKDPKQLHPDPGGMVSSEDLFIEYVVKALAVFGSDSKEAVKLLIPLLSHSNNDIQAEAAFTLECIGESSAPAIDQLAELAKEADKWQTYFGSQSRAWSALCECGKEGIERAVKISNGMEASWIDLSQLREDCGRFQALIQLKQLTQLKVYDTIRHDPDGEGFQWQNPVTPLPVQKDRNLELIKKFKQVESLELPLNTSNELLKKLHNFKNLKSIKIENDWDSRTQVVLDDESLFHLSQIESLEHLIINGHLSVTSEGIDHLRRLKNLKKLLFHNDSLLASDIKVLNRLHTLEWLDIGGKMNEDSLKHLKNLPQLKSFDPPYDIGDLGAKHIAANLPQLESLYLNFSNITSGAVGDLSKMKNLKYLALWNTDLANDPALSELIEALPNCRVVNLD
ncbi:MAG: hypothetical protein AAF939_18425 [Planctomycetota bacterium]